MNYQTTYSRRNSSKVQVGTVTIGGDSPISVQSMTNTDTRDVESTTQQIKQLTAAGADLVRVAVPDKKAAEALGDICRMVSVPIVADIHFNYELAIQSIESGVDKVRINPGNFTSDYLDELVAAAKSNDIPLRIGVNGGSLPRELVSKYGVSAEAMVLAAEEYIELMQRRDFHDIVLSLKASQVPMTVKANEQIAEITSYPLHLGITEAGGQWRGQVKSATGLGYLLGNGIGDTIRVSLTGDPVHEVRVGRAILAAWNLGPSGLNIISCPTCGRCQVDLQHIADRVHDQLSDLSGNLNIAVMGCEVNGPGEARHADVGLACGKGSGILMRNGEIVRKVSEKNMVKELVSLVKQHLKQ